MVWESQDYQLIALLVEFKPAFTCIRSLIFLKNQGDHSKDEVWHLCSSSSLLIVICIKIAKNSHICVSFKSSASSGITYN